MERALRSAALVALALSAQGCFIFRSHRVDEISYVECRLPPGEIQGRAAEVDSLYAPPRTAERVERSFRLALDSVSPSNGYQGLWQAVRAAEWLAERLPDKKEKDSFARKGIALGREAVRKAPERAEPHYYLARSLGRLSDILKTPKFLDEMAGAAEAALRIDERLDRAGPHRFLGLLHLNTVGQPFVGFGDLDKALGHLRRAAELFPEDASNRIDLARCLIEDEDFEGARRELDAALAAKALPGLEDEDAHRELLRQAKDLRAKIEGKK